MSAPTPHGSDWQSITTHDDLIESWFGRASCTSRNVVGFCIHPRDGAFLVSKVGWRWRPMPLGDRLPDTKHHHSSRPHPSIIIGGRDFAEMLTKGPLRPCSKPMTSSSTSKASAAPDEISFSLEPSKGKGWFCLNFYRNVLLVTSNAVTRFHPLITPSPLLDPKELERRQHTASR